MKKLLITLCILTLALMLTACFAFLRDLTASPALQEGERYYEGDVAFAYAERCTVSFILSADGKRIHDASVRMEKLSFELPYEGRIVEHEVGLQMTACGGGELNEQGRVELKRDKSDIVLRIAMDENGARGEMDYSYKAGEMSIYEVDLFVGTYPFEVSDMTGKTEK